MDFSEPTGVLLRAVHFAADKHRSQRRKDAAQSPYIDHPIEVARLLWEVGGVRAASVIVAAPLHDTIEDTETTRQELRDLFGDEVLSVVLELTDDKRLDKAERKQLQIVNATHKSVAAKLIALADKCCNVRDLLQSPPRDWSVGRRREYLIWTEQVVAGLRGASPALEAYYDRELSEGRVSLGIE
jgi:guanosine-3',5'-bis(diphosphate) 3'-pyrophosphohydrolase